MDARQFESFLRSIGRCASLLDARRLKNDIVGEVQDASGYRVFLLELTLGTNTDLLIR